MATKTKKAVSSNTITHHLKGKKGAQGHSEVEQIMREYDRESRTRIWEGKWRYIIDSLMVAFSLYCIGMTLFSTELPETKLARFLALIVVLGMLNYPASKHHVRTNFMPWYDIVIMVAGAFSFLYFAFNAYDIIMMTSRLGVLEVVFGVIGILVLAELTRRCVGLPILCVAGALIIYAFIYHFGYGYGAYDALRLVVYKLFYTTSGVIGTPINVCYTYIVLFIIFGAFLERTGIAQYFIACANKLAGWSSGGAAKVAVISSALCGMVSGSSVGNTVTTGSVTIPMMKKTGYKPEFAAAVEAASSTGGQIMPPIMGAAAFLMAEFIGRPYIEVVTLAIVPAVLYFAGIFIAVHLEAKKLGLKGKDRKLLPKGTFLLFNCYLLVPLVLLVWLVADGVYSMAYSAAISILVAFIIGFINLFCCRLVGGEGLGDPAATNKGKKDVRDALKYAGVNAGKTTYQALVSGAKSVITVACACAMAGIIAGCITVTGLASVLVNAIAGVAGNAVILGLFLTMLCCIVLGMGVPTTANYCIMASTCAPILISLGVNPIAAHFFVFYFGIVADITPPVALAAYAGSAIAQSNPMKTGVNASKLAIAAFIVPYIFALNPVLLMQGDFTVLEFAFIILTALVGLFGVAAGLNGNLRKRIPVVLRIVLIAAGIGSMIPDVLWSIVGMVVIGGITAFQYVSAGKQKKAEMFIEDGQEEE